MTKSVLSDEKTKACQKLEIGDFQGFFVLHPCNVSSLSNFFRCLPMNFSPDDLVTGVVKERMKIGSSLADVDPMKIDREVTFEQVGGLETYVRSLKEMILFPLLYPEVFQKFTIQPPRGVLFYGPPG